MDSDPAARRAIFERLFVQYRQRVAVWCLRFSGDREAAADLAQDVFLKAYSALPDFKGGSKFSTWLYSITRNHCLNYAKSAARRTQDKSEELSESLVDVSSSDPLQGLELESEFQLARRVMAEQLTPTEISVMTLRYVEDLPMKTITRVLQLDNQSGAKAYIVSAKRKLEKAVARMRSRNSRPGGHTARGRVQ